MSMSTEILKWSASIILFSLAACSRPHSVVPIPASAGQSSFLFLPNEPSPDALPKKDEEIVPPLASGQLALPSYPPAALAAKFGYATMVLRLVIGTDGRIAGIEQSPHKISSGGAFEKEFRASIEEAVQKWVFHPAEWRRLEDGEDLNGDGKIDFRRVVESRKIVVHYDVQFEFDIMNGKGQVRAH